MSKNLDGMLNMTRHDPIYNLAQGVCYKLCGISNWEAICMFMQQNNGMFQQWDIIPVQVETSNFVFCL